MKQQKGITLIALVVTVVVLLILAAISINIAFGNNGIFKQAQMAAGSTANAIDYEANTLGQQMEDFIEEALKSEKEPGELTVNLSSKTNNSITIESTANAEGMVTYKLFISDSPEGDFTEKATVESTDATEKATLTANDLTDYTDYYYYVTATSGGGTVQSNIASVRTYCKTTLCTGSVLTSTKCTTCDGEGEVPRYCTGTVVYDFVKQSDAPAGNNECDTCGKSLGGIYFWQVWGTCSRCRQDDLYGVGFWYCSASCAQVRADRNHSGSCDKVTGYSTCSTCEGEGQRDVSEPCEHGYNIQHYFCDHGYFDQEYHD